MPLIFTVWTNKIFLLEISFYRVPQIKESHAGFERHPRDIFIISKFYKCLATYQNVVNSILNTSHLSICTALI